jgi:hypothetical protein
MATVNTADTNKQYILSVKLALDPQIERALTTLGQMRTELNKTASELRTASKEFAAQGGNVDAAAASLAKYQSTLKGMAGTNLNAATASLHGWNAALNQTEAELSTLPQKMQIVTQRLVELKAQGLQGGAAWQTYTSELKRLTDTQNKLNSANQGSVAGMGNLRFAAQNASFQFTDMVVSLQGGIAASTVMAQQIPQLLGGFGAAGAAAGLVVALAASISGPLINSMFAGMNAAKQFDDAMSALNEAIGLVGQTSKTIDMDPLRKEYNAASATTRALISDQLNLQKVLIETRQIIANQAVADVFKGAADFGFVDKLKGAFGGTQADQMAKDLGVAKERGAEVLRVVRGVANGSIDAANAVQLIGEDFARSTNPQAQKYLKTLMEADKASRDGAKTLGEVSKIQNQIAKGGQLALDKVAGGTKGGGAKKEDLAIFQYYSAAQDVFAEMGKLAEAALPLTEQIQIIEQNRATWEAWGITSTKVTEIIAKKEEAVKRAAGTWTLLDQAQKDITANQAAFDDYVSSVERLIYALEGGEISPEKFTETLEAISKYAPAVKKAEEATKSFADEISVAVGTTLANSLGDLVDALLSSQESFREWAANALKELGKVLVKMAAVAAFKQAMESAGGFGGILKMLGFAQGGAFAHAGLAPNQILTKPTPFMFAQGGVFGSRMGVAGEDGPEAVVPLRETPSGDLGVAASPVNIVINNNTDGTARVEVAENNKADGTREITMTIRRELKAAMSDGSMDTSMRNNYNMSRKGLA